MSCIANHDAAAAIAFCSDVSLNSDDVLHDFSALNAEAADVCSFAATSLSFRLASNSADNLAASSELNTFFLKSELGLFKSLIIAVKAEVASQYLLIYVVSDAKALQVNPNDAHN
jgi:hypothetical protein